MKKRILLVDDHPDIFEFMQLSLEFCGYEVLVAKDGSEAVTKAISHVPDLIIMDMFMPKMDGFQATSLIRAHPKTKHIPIVAATAAVTEESLKRCLDAGCDEYLAKPFNLRELLRIVERLLK
jgi:CheY-like chemotaxis protein